MTVKLTLNLGDSETALTIHGKANIKLYSVPEIHRIEPNRGFVQGGTEIIVSGKNLNSGFGNVKCVFGELAVEAKFVNLGSTLSCVS